MTDSTAESFPTNTVSLLTYYSDEGDNSPHAALLDHWLESYPPDWVRLALIEALYRGRYKTISVGSLLADWQRRGQPTYHFNAEFEALICHDFPQIWFGQDPDPSAHPSSASWPLASVDHAQPSMTITAHTFEGDDISSSPSAPVADRQAWSSDLEFSGAENSANLAPRTSLETDQLRERATDSPLLEDMFSLTEPEGANLLFEHPPSRMEPPTEFQRQEVAPIHQFTPDRTPSGHYQKLVAMVSKRPHAYDQQATPINSVAS